MGDSYAAGEGVPDLGRNYFRKAIWMDRRCHRSLFSGPGLAALMYAKLNPHVSVTHLTFACSGATLNVLNDDEGAPAGGLLLPYAGVVKKRPPLPPQVDALKAALSAANAKPDFVTLSIGGNDLGFGPVVRSGLQDDVAKLEKTIDEWLSDADKRINEATLAYLEKSLEAANASKATGATVLVTGYPNTSHLRRQPPSSAADGTPYTERELSRACGAGGGHVLSFGGRPLDILGDTLTAEKLAKIETKMLPALHRLVQRIADAIGAERQTDEDMARFSRHGFCGPGLNRKSLETRWVNNIPDSWALLGMPLSIAGYELFPEGLDGAMHPNIRGQADFGLWLLSKIVAAECATGRIEASDPLRARVCGSDKSWLQKFPGGIEQ